VSVHPDIDSNSDSDESFVSRWSRRKQEAQPDTDPAAEASEPLEQDSATAARPVLTDADMPDPDSLQAESDFAAFMSPGVSEQLRAQALRRLFRLPGLHIPDGLDDYDDDFTGLPGLGNTLTHDMRRMLAREAKTQDETPSTATGQADPASMQADAEPADEPGEDAADHAPEPSTEPQRPV
jgi:hypothetical protein